MEGIRGWSTARRAGGLAANEALTVRENSRPRIESLPRRQTLVAVPRRQAIICTDNF